MLTQREQQVLALVGRGYSIPQIADKLFRSQKTIETHRQSLGRKLGVSNRVELARIAILTGLSPLDTAAPRSPDDPRQALQDDPAAARAMQRIESACALVVGEAYGHALVRHLATELGVAGALLDYRIDHEEKCGCLSGWYRGKAMGAMALELPPENSPGMSVIRDGFFRAERDVAQRFAEWAGLMPWPIHSYMGIRLEDTTRTPWVGMLVLFQDEPVEFPAAAESVLRVCAVRAAAETCRMKLIDNLQSSVETLEARLAGLEGGG